MWWSVLLVIAGLVLVWVAAEQLVKAAVGLAAGLRASTFVIAVVFLGFDPENLAVGAVGTAQDAPGLAAATIIGSAMVALTLALGLAALVAPMRFAHAPRRVLAIPVVMTILLVALAADGLLSRLDGGVLVGAYLVGVAGVTLLGRRGLDLRPSGEVAKELPKAQRLGLARSGLLLAAAIVVIVIAGELLVTGTKDLLEWVGWSQTILGMTALALALSIEEVGREVIPALRGHPEIAVGNVIGSVLAFFGLNAGIIALVRPLAIDRATRHFYLPVAAITVLGITVLLATRHLPRWSGALLVAVYLAFATGGYLIYGTTAT